MKTVRVIKSVNDGLKRAFVKMKNGANTWSKTARKRVGFAVVDKP